MEKLFEFFNKTGPYPRLTFLGINGVDLAGHFQGPSSELYSSCLIETDKIIGELTEFLKGRKDNNGKPLFDKSLFVIFGDHGMVDSENFIDIAALLKAEGMKVSDLGSIAHLVTEKINPFWMVDREILSVPGGSNITELYVRKKQRGRFLEWDEFCSYRELREYPIQSWFQDSKIDLLTYLSGIEGIGEIIAGIQENVVHVITPNRGSATIFRRPGMGNDTFVYRIDDPNARVDPFGYLQSEAAIDLVCTDPDMSISNWVEERFDHYFYSIRDWVRATLDTGYPAAVPLIPKALAKHHTASDIIVNAKSPYNFSKYFKGDHGILENESVSTAMLIAGEGVCAGASLEGMMLIDTLPTLLKILNIRPPASFERFLDGKIYNDLAEPQ